MPVVLKTYSIDDNVEDLLEFPNVSPTYATRYSNLLDIMEIVSSRADEYLFGARVNSKQINREECHSIIGVMEVIAQSSKLLNTGQIKRAKRLIVKYLNRLEERDS